MPELPDVDGFRRYLTKHAQGRRILRVDVPDREIVRNRSPQALGRSVARPRPPVLGTVGDAEDVVQEAFLRLARTRQEGTRVENARAFLTTVTTRLAIDQLRSARARRETYFGPWLPEPMITVPDPDPAEVAEMADSLSLSLLVLLETPSPVERAVFLLREVFDYGSRRSARSSIPTRSRTSASRYPTSLCAK